MLFLSGVILLHNCGNVHPPVLRRCSFLILIPALPSENKEHSGCISEYCVKLLGWTCAVHVSAQTSHCAAARQWYWGTQPQQGVFIFLFFAIISEHVVEVLKWQVTQLGSLVLAKR